MTSRQVVLQVHLWVGLGAGLILAVVGATGSLYVIEPELSRLLSADTYVTAGEASRFASDQDLVRYIEAETGGRIESLQWPRRGRETYLFKLFGDARWHHVDQTTGRITAGDENFGNAALAFVLDLHTTLTIGPVGIYVTGTASLLLALVLISTGLYLWWPRSLRVLRKRVTVKREASGKSFHYALHSAGGFWFAIPLFLMALTGAYFAFYETAQRVVDVLTFSEPAVDGWSMRSAPPSPERAPLTIVQALDVMDRHHTGFHRRNLWMTDDPTGTLSLGYQGPEEGVHAGPDRRVFLTVDRYTGALLHEYNPDLLPRGSRLTARWAGPLHYGEFAGWPTRILWAAGGLLPALLLFTGFMVWWKPRRWPFRSRRKALKSGTRRAAVPVRPGAVSLRDPVLHTNLD